MFGIDIDNVGKILLFNSIREDFKTLDIPKELEIYNYMSCLLIEDPYRYGEEDDKDLSNVILLTGGINNEFSEIKDVTF